MFGWGRKDKEETEDIILNDAYEQGELGAEINDGEMTDDMLTRGVRAAQEVHGISDPEQISNFALAYANGYRNKVWNMDLEDDLHRDPYEHVKD